VERDGGGAGQDESDNVDGTLLLSSATLAAPCSDACAASTGASSFATRVSSFGTALTCAPHARLAGTGDVLEPHPALGEEERAVSS
jgi:hypothetical protein